MLGTHLPDLELLNFEDREIIGSDCFDVSDMMNPVRAIAEQPFSRIFDYCVEIWEIVKPVLCVESPEGFEADESEDHDLETRPKDTLSFAWRALKESRYHPDPSYRQSGL